MNPFFLINHLRKRIFIVLANSISRILPPTHMFALRNSLYRFAGLNIARGAKIVGGSVFHFSNVTISNGTWIGSGCQFYSSKNGKIIIGENVHMGPWCILSTGTHEIGDPLKRAGKNVATDIEICRGSWIGMGVTITSGVLLGKGCVVAAGTVLIGCYPENCLIAGVPGRIKKYLSSD